MKLIVLGSGTSVPHARRASPAYWLQTQSGSMLLDISPDASHRMAQEGLDWANLDAIWVSHFHLDHMGGLAAYLFGMKWAPQTQERTRPLKIFGARGLRDLFAAIDSSNDYKLLKQPFPIEFVEVEPATKFDLLPNVTATTLATPHTKESLALRLLENRRTSFVYTSDTGFSEELVPFAKGVDLLLMECSFIRNKSLQTHLELAEAMLLAEQCAPKTLVLTHLYPEWDGIDLAAEAKTLWRGETIEAFDGLRLDI
jgi:ribonuclease BN (tRNA processing enzyme)